MTTLPDLFAEAVRRHQGGRLGEAEQLYERVLASEPKHVDALHLLGVLAAQSGDHERAVALIAAALAVSDDFALAHYNLGNALRALERNGEAAAAFSRAADLRPDHAASHNNLGAVLRRLGRNEDAAAAFSRAIDADPNHAEAHYNLGGVLDELGRSNEAVAAYRRAIAVKPDYADAHVNLGVILQDRGDREGALACYQRALAARPNHAEALIDMAGLLQALGRYGDALAAYRKAATLKPNEAAARAEIGTALQALGRHDEAVEAYREALAIDPRNAGALVSLAVALQELGAGSDALDAVDQGLAIDPTSARGWLVRSDLKTFTAGDLDIDALEQLISTAGARAIGLEDRIDLAFALGKALADTGEVDRAFAQLSTGNRLRRSSLSYDVGADIARLEAIARAFTPTLADRLAGGGHPSDRPVFIVGMPRSGTTLAEQVLASHPEVHGAGELPILGDLVANAFRGGFPRGVASVTVRDLTRLGGAYIDSVAGIGAGSRRLVDKMPGNFPLVGLIQLILPKARIIHCRRDPIDTCLSCYSKAFSGRQDFAYDLRELGLYYRAYDALMTHWRGLLPPVSFIEVEYEQLVGDFEAQARRLIGFCGLEWDDACLDFHTTQRTVRTASVNQVRQPLYRGSIGRWKPYERHLAPLIAALNGL